eukprot:TRINITY_DN559_c0_g1_i2.p1 TRINITY_DN559_c0_g1~~TRINITY_DN559_c0_g1_i2.p1  ORF type:complete len:488 (+),score=178.80 TRINITY_DN559_c0_g1_i2:618-2081(+)
MPAASTKEYDRKDFELAHLGLPEDGYDYSQHLKSFAGPEAGAVYLGKDGHVAGEAPPVEDTDTVVLGGAGAVIAPGPMLGEELFATREDERLGFMTQKDAGGGLRAGMDLEVMAALDMDSDQEGEVEALDDDFIFQADGDSEDEDFDADGMMGGGGASSSKATGAAPSHHGYDRAAGDGSDDDEYAEYSTDEDEDEDGAGGRSMRGSGAQSQKSAGGRSLRRFDYFAETERKSVVGTSIASSRRDHLKPRFFDEHFDHIVDRYDDDDDILDADPDDERIDGALVPEEAIDHLLDEFLEQEAKYKNDQDSNWHDPDAAAETKQYIKDNAESIAAAPAAPMPEIHAPRKSQHQWDCESILSTYSNVDNHPTKIAAPQKNKTKRVTLNKRGLPEEFEAERRAAAQGGVDGAPDDDDDSASFESQVPVNKGVARNKKEGKDEKKARKAAIKAERAAARERKKNLKKEFKKEGMRQGQIAAAQKNNISGVKL